MKLIKIIPQNDSPHAAMALAEPGDAPSGVVQRTKSVQPP